VPEVNPVPIFGAASSGRVTQQVDLVLAGAILSEATSDAPNGMLFNAPDREKRRPTFLYIRPLPLPELIPDIELPLP
jgi:hypothetical protein